jgi:hypothetical protein
MTSCISYLGPLLAAMVAAALAAAAPPQITSLSPLALAPGKTTELSIPGQHLLDTRSLWTSFAARCELLPAADESAKKGEKLVCRVTVPREAQVGIGAVRAVTGEGVSNPLLVMLDDLPTTPEAADNHAADKAQAITVPMAVDGQCEAVQEDWFRFHAAAGERIAFEVVAERLGSKLDPVLRLAKADGAVLVRVDDAAGAGGDSRFVHTFEAEGDYLLAVSDVRHAGGGEYRYRLRAGRFPLFASVYPSGARGGDIASLELVELGSDAKRALHLAVPGGAEAGGIVWLGVPSVDGAGAGWFPFAVGGRAETLEQEPNDTAQTATAAQIAGALNGRLDKPGDRDFFTFTARKGQRVRCVAMTRELGSACDLYISLQKMDGTQLAVARQERQTVLGAEIPDDGEYLLQVENLLAGDATNRVYRVDVSDTYDGFTLHAEQAQYSAPRGGTFVVKVLAQRRGYNGPIELSVAGLGDGVKLEGNKFDGPETLLKITLPESIAAGELRQATIIGTAKVGEESVAVPADQREPLRAVFPNALTLPADLATKIAVGIGPAFPPFFGLGLADNNVYFPQIVGASTFDINIKRLNEAFKEPVALVVEGLPAGITAEVAPVGDGLAASRVSLKGPTDLAESRLPIRIVGTGKFQEQTRTVVLQDVTLHVTRPLVVSVAMAGPIAPGGGQQAEVRVQRFGDDPQPVRLQVGDGPAGLSAPIFVTIPGDANQAKIPLSAGADAPPGQFSNLTVVASTTVKGQNVVVHSPPATVTIQPPAAE